jgi:hypothetical protein
MNTAENIAYALPIGQTGGIREATRIVRKHAAHLDPKLFDDVVGAVVKRSRECLSQTSFSPALVPCTSPDTASLLPGVAPLSLRSLAKHRQYHRGSPGIQGRVIVLLADSSSSTRSTLSHVSEPL